MLNSKLFNIAIEKMYSSTIPDQYEYAIKNSPNRFHRNTGEIQMIKEHYAWDAFAYFDITDKLDFQFLYLKMCPVAKQLHCHCYFKKKKM